ncbi:MAG TPA: helix-turn-helix transcriptional regulator [Nitriliruptoraceae bacterium]|nr:helix-turn-helix transcriptional regulator [Nitriliruptoraceae bacterium]
MPKVPKLVFDGSSLTPEEDFEVFHHATRPLFHTAPLSDLASFRSRSTDCLVDDLLVNRISYGRQTLQRTRRHLGNGTSEWITVQVYLEGNLTGRAGERLLDFGPERIGVLDLAQTFTAWSDRTDAIWVCVPRSRLAHVNDRYGRHPLRTLHRSSRRGQVLGAAIERLWRRLSQADERDAPALAAGIVDTIDTALAADRYVPTDRDLLTAMEHHIAVHLDDLCLDTASLQDAFHCSRSALYRLFEHHRGVATYIREQRLIRCFAELSEPDDPPKPVGQVATRWGFENPSHFHRLFVGRFGLPPSALARRPRFEPAGVVADPQVSSRIASFRRWAESGPRLATGSGAVPA